MTQNRIAKSIVIHPNYDPYMMRNDIGMVMLDAPLHFNRWVRPACFPNKNILGSIWEQVPSVDTMCVVMGWGAWMERGPDSKILSPSSSLFCSLELLISMGIKFCNIINQF